MYTASLDAEGNYEYVAPNGAKLQISKDNDLTIVDDQGNTKTYTEKEVKNMVAVSLESYKDHKAIKP